MPLNLLKKYSGLLDINGLNENQRKASLQGIFDRDIRNNPNFVFNSKTIRPIVKDGMDAMEILLHHLTTTIVDEKTRKRDYDRFRSERLHWIKHHISSKQPNGLFIFSVKDKTAIRTYIYDSNEKYVIILEPFRNTADYYLLTAYHLTGKNKNKIKSKYKRRLNKVY